MRSNRAHRGGAVAAEALTDGLAGWMMGAMVSLAGIVVFIGVRQQRPALSVAGAGFVLLAAGLWQAHATTGAAAVAVAALITVAALALWLVHRALRGLRAGRAQQASLLAELASCRAELDQSQRQMQQAQAAAEAADQAKARFLAAASHDLRQPAHALGLYTAALRAGPLAPQQAEIAERMQRSLAALDTLFAALLDVSRMDAGAVLPQWDTVALAPLLHRLADEWAPQAEARGLRLSLHISQSDVMSVTDPVLLERVLRNLLANAIKYTPQGGVLLACRLRGQGEQQQLRVEVWDSGVGIAAGDQERVFEEFFQTETAHRSQGLGLGLAIVQRLARLLQLHVTLHSRPGRGTVFFVEGLAPAGIAPQTAAAARQGMRRLAGLLVVVLEDDAEVRDAMRRLLQLWDCRVIDGTQAADVLRALPTPAQAVIADLRLADGRTGRDEVRLLHAAWQTETPVLWISAETAADGLRATLPPGAAVLTKPVSPTRLRRWLEQRLLDADPNADSGDRP